MNFSNCNKNFLDDKYKLCVILRLSRGFGSIVRLELFYLCDILSKLKALVSVVITIIFNSCHFYPVYLMKRVI